MDDTCDFPGCSLPINQKCARCGRAMCVRHIQWVGDQTVGGGLTYSNVLSAHYACDLCLHPVQTGQLFAQQTGWTLPGRSPGIFSVRYQDWKAYHDAWYQAYNAWSWNQPVPPPPVTGSPWPPRYNPSGPPLKPRSFGEAFHMWMFVRPSEQQEWLARQRGQHES